MTNSLGADTRGKFGRYILTGGTAAVVDLAGFTLLLWAGMPLLAAAVVSFLAAAVVNFTLTSAFVFRMGGGMRRFGMFLLFAVLGLALNAGVTVLGVELVGLPPALAKLGGIGVAFGFNFLANALIVFRAA